MKIIEEIIWYFRCMNCNYGCVQNTQEITLKSMREHGTYPDINRGTCPKLYPLSIWLRFQLSRYYHDKQVNNARKRGN